MAQAMVLSPETVAAPTTIAPPIPGGLLRLPHEWERLDAVALAQHVVDHVVIGPNGVFAVTVDPDDSEATLTADGVVRTGERVKQVVKRALFAATELRNHVGEHVLPYPVLVTGITGRGWLGRLGVAGPEACAELIWSHPGRPLTRTERSEVAWSLGARAHRV